MGPGRWRKLNWKTISSYSSFSSCLKVSGDALAPSPLDNFFHSSCQFALGFDGSVVSSFLHPGSQAQLSGLLRGVGKVAQFVACQRGRGPWGNDFADRPTDRPTTQRNCRGESSTKLNSVDGRRRCHRRARLKRPSPPAARKQQRKHKNVK